MEQSTNGSVENPQLDKFKEAARALDCDAALPRFPERVGKLVKAPLGKTPKNDSPTDS